jgi:hypothetical protein
MKLFTHLKKDFTRGFESHPKILPQQLHIALTAVATEHIDKSKEKFS